MSSFIYQIKIISKSIMNRFERMVAIPEEEYNQLRTKQQIANPLETQYGKLASDYEKQSHIENPFTRVHRQGETLDQMIKIKDELRNHIKNVTPKPYQARAENLFNYMKHKLNVTPKGELIKDDGTVIASSNITDLVQHAVRDRRRNMIPSGWSEFLHVLRDSNAPQMLLNYETLEEMQPKKSSVASSSIKLSPTTYVKSKTKSPFGIKTTSSLSPSTYSSPSTKTRRSRSITRSSEKRTRKSSRSKHRPKKYFDYKTGYI